MAIILQKAVKHDFFTRQGGIGGKSRHARTPFMQNKANFRKDQMNINIFTTKDYENQPIWGLRENKPNQSQFLFFTAENAELAELLSFRDGCQCN